MLKLLRIQLGSNKGFPSFLLLSLLSLQIPECLHGRINSCYTLEGYKYHPLALASRAVLAFPAKVSHEVYFDPASIITEDGPSQPQSGQLALQLPRAQTPSADQENAGKHEAREVTGRTPGIQV